MATAHYNCKLAESNAGTPAFRVPPEAWWDLVHVRAAKYNWVLELTEHGRASSAREYSRGSAF